MNENEQLGLDFFDAPEDEPVLIMEPKTDADRPEPIPEEVKERQARVYAEVVKVPPKDHSLEVGKTYASAGGTGLRATVLEDCGGSWRVKFDKKAPGGDRIYKGAAELWTEVEE